MNNNEIIKLDIFLNNEPIQNINTIRTSFLKKLFLPIVLGVYIPFEPSIDNLIVFEFNNLITDLSPEYKNYFNTLKLSNLNFCRLFYYCLDGKIIFKTNVLRASIYKFYKFPNTYQGSIDLAIKNINKDSCQYTDIQKFKLIETLNHMKNNSNYIQTLINTCDIESIHFSTNFTNYPEEQRLSRNFNQFMQYIDNI